ncbi:oxygen-dependent protoporphyrinogen oxidase Ecym_1262 [Eremothecium cymbalariae DBVPG|uniref:Protoporphyrinogen oxidase n=1 Tax=Eremothecium cymbalariae (strain CBS 270.75 / DBVPG 7215 / KCTC 17166 / NRRL Y-17582) TaxID=931890 RepID=G8JN40_ERECY|nr:hypothetical protein Ecym_1262 [Eremothecium cymbalariae DBVPG\
MTIILKKLPEKAKVLVVGGGISGLSFTYFLARLRPDINITLLEASHRCHGYINSSLSVDKQNHKVLMEKGPRTLRGASEGTSLIIDTLMDLNQKSKVYCLDPSNEANRKFLLDSNNKLIQTPNSLSTLLKFLLSTLGKGLIPGILGEPFRKKATTTSTSDETAFSLFSRRFGNKYVAENLLGALYHGIYADDIKKLSARHVSKKFYEMERDHGSFVRAMFSNKLGKSQLTPVLELYQKTFAKDPEQFLKLYQNLGKYPILGLKEGLETLPKTLLHASKAFPNVTIHTNKKVTQLGQLSNGKFEVHTEGGERFNDLDHLRLTVNPSTISNIVTQPKLSNALRLLQSNTIMLVNFYLPNKDVIKQHHGFGYLVPVSNKNPEMLLGVIFDSIVEQNYQPFFASKEPTISKGPYTKLTAMLGGHYLTDNKVESLPSTEEIINTVKRVFFTQLNISKSDLNQAHWEVSIVSDSIPKFHVGYEKWMQAVSKDVSQFYNNNISLGGMAFSSGPGVPDVFTNAFLDAQKVAQA